MSVLLNHDCFFNPYHSDKGQNVPYEKGIFLDILSFLSYI